MNKFLSAAVPALAIVLCAACSEQPAQKPPAAAPETEMKMLKVEGRYR